jgi:hypothetical protein
MESKAAKDKDKKPIDFLDAKDRPRRCGTPSK